MCATGTSTSIRSASSDEAKVKATNEQHSVSRAVRSRGRLDARFEQQPQLRRCRALYLAQAMWRTRRRTFATQRLLDSAQGERRRHPGQRLRPGDSANRFGLLAQILHRAAELDRFAMGEPASRCDGLPEVARATPECSERPNGLRGIGPTD
jgi:hypothetical protein